MSTRTLVVHAGGIGDFILACPALRELAKETQIELAGIKERLQLAVTAGIADAAHDLDAVAFDSIFSEPRPTFVAFIRHFQRVIIWMRDDGTVDRALRDLGITDIRIFPGLPPDGWSRHAAEYYAECLGLPPRPTLLEIEPAASAYDVIIHPGSGATHKNWPSDRFVELAQSLERNGRAVHWSVGPAEEDLPLPPNAPTLPPQALVDLAATLAAARLYIGNDSGITHLAAVVGCSTIAIFGPTNPDVWAPVGNHVCAVHSNPWPSVAEVLSAVETLRATR